MICHWQELKHTIMHYLSMQIRMGIVLFRSESNIILKYSLKEDREEQSLEGVDKFFRKPEKGNALRYL